MSVYFFYVMKNIKDEFFREEQFFELFFSTILLNLLYNFFY